MIDIRFDISSFVDTKTIESVKANIVNNFVKRRKEYGISQKQLSEQSGVSYASIRRFEQTGEISLSSLIRISDAINKIDDLDELFKSPVIKDINIK